MKTQRLLELDALRGLAALMVTFAHFHVGSQFMETVGFYGQFGVQLFFIISGFVIFQTIQSCYGLFDFIYLRFSRLYPVYWAAILITVLIYVSFPFLGVRLTIKQVLLNLSMYQSFFHVQHVSIVYWTLWVEMKFYILMILLMLFKQIKRISIVCTIWLLFTYIYPIAKIPLLHELYVIANPEFAHFFISGIVFYRIYHHEAIWLDRFNLLGCLLTVYYLSTYDVAFLITLFYVFFILFVYGKLHYFKNPVLIYFGVISYSLYLIHAVIGETLIVYLKTINYSSPWILFMCASIASYGVASILTFVVEKPSLRLLRSMRQKPKTTLRHD